LSQALFPRGQKHHLVFSPQGIGKLLVTGCCIVNKGDSHGTAFVGWPVFLNVQGKNESASEKINETDSPFGMQL